MVTDHELILGLERCKALGALPMVQSALDCLFPLQQWTVFSQVHAENGDAVALAQQRVFESGIVKPVGHVLSRPIMLEAEATQRAIRLAEFVQVPLFVVHVTSKEAMLEVPSTI